MAIARGERVHGRYVIRTMVSGGKVRARAFLGREAVADAEGICVDDALRAMRAALDERDTRRRAARRDGIPTTEEFADAFSPRPEPEDRRAPLAHAGRTPRRAGADANRDRDRRRRRVCLLHGRELATRDAGVADDLGHQPNRRADGSPIWTMTLATGADPGRGEDDGRWRWRMRPQVAECLLGIRPGPGAA